jgi:hypothetical protein
MADTETTTIDQPAETQSGNPIQKAMSGWMEGLRSALPNPSLSSVSQNEEQPPEPEPEPTTKTEVKPEPKAQPKPEAQDAPKGTLADLPEDKWPRSAKEWKHFTSLRKQKDEEHAVELAKRETRIKELEAKTIPGAVSPDIQKQLDDMKQENEAYSKQLRLVSVTNHPRFKSYFDNKTNAVLAQLKSCVAADELEKATRLVQAPDSESKEAAIDAALENMTTLQKNRFMGVISGLSAIESERQSEVSRAQQDYEQMVAAAKTEKEGKQARFNKLLDDTVKSMTDSKAGRPEYQMREGDDAWNASVQKRIESGKQLITGNLAPETMFKAAFDAAAYSDVLAGYKVALSEVEKLKKQVAAMTAASPRVEPTKRTEPTAANGSSPRMPNNPRSADYTKDWVRRFGESMRGET